MLIAVMAALGVAILIYVVALACAAVAVRTTPRFEAIGLGAIVSFFDVLHKAEAATPAIAMP